MARPSFAGWRGTAFLADWEQRGPVYVGEGAVQPLWSCAAAIVAEADRLLAPAAETPKVIVPSAENEAKKPIVVRFSSSPSDADVSIDGESRDYTPTTDFTDVSEGPHTIEIKKPGYKLWEQKITLAPGDNRTVSVVLEPHPVDPSKPRIVGN
jgi:PEGA domain